MTKTELRNAEIAYKRAAQAAERARAQRNEVLQAALRAGWSLQQISDATGLSRGRISQISR